MKKELTLKNYVIYVCRYWLITAICVVVGLATMLFYGIFSKEAETTVYEGNITFGGISNFFNVDTNAGEGQTNLYNSIRSYALELMSAPQLQTDLYKEVSADWKALNGRMSDSSAQTAFYEAFAITRSNSYMYVSFSQVKGDEQHNAFAVRVVDRYLDLARESAIHYEKILEEEGKLVVTPATLQTVENSDESTGLLLNCVIGIAIGLVLGLVIMFVVYFADRRINSYGDIAQITGNRLLGIGKSATGNETCPQIDCAMGDDKTLVVCGSAAACGNVSNRFAAYSSGTGRKTLLMDFSRRGEDALGAYLDGKSLDALVREENGVSVLCGGASWARANKERKRIEALKDAYERVVICAPYGGDGASAVLTAMSDKVVFALDQGAIRCRDVASIAQEAQAGYKAIGAVIDNAGKSFVGEKTYFAETEEE